MQQRMLVSGRDRHEPNKQRNYKTIHRGNSLKTNNNILKQKAKQIACSKYRDHPWQTRTDQS